MIEHHRSVGVDMQQTPGLIEMRRRERNAELHRRQRDAALHIRARRVERSDRAAPGMIVGALLEIGDDVVNHVVDDRLPVVCDVAFGDAVQIRFAHGERVFAERTRDVVDHLLDTQHALRSAETAERGVRHGVRFAAKRLDRHILQVITVIAVKHRAIVDGARQIDRVPATARQREAHAENAPVVIEADVILGDEVMPLSGDPHIVVAIHAQLHRPLRFLRKQRRDACEESRLTFLAAERAAHAPALDDDILRRDIQCMGNLMLVLARILRRAVDVHRSIFLRKRVRDHPFEIELLLAADADFSRKPMGRLRNRAVRIAADQALGGQNERLRRQRGFRVERRRELVVFDFRQPRRPPRGGDCRCGNGENRLTVILNERRREDRIVGDDRTVIVLSGNVFRSDDRDDAGRALNLTQVDRLDPRVRAIRHADRGVQRTAHFRNVVGVERRAAHMQMRAVVRQRRANGAFVNRHARAPRMRTRSSPRPARSFRRTTGAEDSS